MADVAFFPEPVPITLSEVIALTAARPLGPVDLHARFGGAAPVGEAGPQDIAYADSAKYLAEASGTRAGACFCTSTNAEKIARGTVRLIVENPHLAHAMVVAKLYPTAMRPLPIAGEIVGVAAGAMVHQSAVLEEGVFVEAGAVVGPEAEIGTGTRIAPNAVIGPAVRIGRNGSVGPNATVLHALIGDNVIVHPGVNIGQDGFGFVPGPSPTKVPQIGRVVIQDNVEIGAGTTIDRGTNTDTTIGEGTKIDNQVQIAHNVAIGRRCLIAAQVGISGSVTIGDYVVIGGQAGLTGHISIGAGAQIAGVSAVYRDVPPGVKWGGAPARPLREWLRAQSRDLKSGRDRSRTSRPKQPEQPDD